MASTSRPSNFPSQSKPIYKREITTATLKDSLRKTARNTFKKLRHQHIDEMRGITTKETLQKSYQLAYRQLIMESDEYNILSNEEINQAFAEVRNELLEQEFILEQENLAHESDKIVEYLFTCIVCEDIIASGNFCNNCTKEFV